MAHLYKFRKGWENENLARFILSKFSFIAQPVTIADDIGTDFFCTIFDRQRINKDECLLPKTSFAIQIKSNKRALNVTNKHEYLNNLEVPFFVGVINQNQKNLTIYSGEVLPKFFSLVGKLEKLHIKLVKKNERFETISGLKKYTIPFPEVMVININIDQKELECVVSRLNTLCKKMQQNISSKLSEEYIFEDFSHKVIEVIAGKYSYQVFRDNILKRLAEAFCNLAWIYPQIKDDRQIAILKEEFNAYKSFYLKIKKLYSIPEWLKDYFQRLEKIVEK